MQREIEFKGKRVKDGKWIKGTLTTWNGGACKDHILTWWNILLSPKLWGSIPGLKTRMA
jgi:hypothetical protein